MEDFQKKGTTFEITAESRAVELFKENPSMALRGNKTISAETDIEVDRSDAMFKLATDEPERFLELVGYLPHLIQDIFYQYYLLGRTQTQIAQLLGCSQTNIWQDLRLGKEAICAIIAFGGPPPTSIHELRKASPGEQFLKAITAYQAMLAFKTRKDQRKPITVEEPKTLGQFQLSIDDGTFDRSEERRVGKECRL